MTSHNNTSRSSDHAGPLMRHLSDYAQETLKVMFHTKLMAIQGKQDADRSVGA